MKNIQEKIDNLNELINDKKLEIQFFELDEEKHVESYDEMLNDCYEELFNMQPSRILLECDPIAYNCGLSDYVNSLELSEDEDYQDLENELEDLENELEDLENELDEENN